MHDKKRFISKYEEREKDRDVPANEKVGRGEKASLDTRAKSPEETHI